MGLMGPIGPIRRVGPVGRISRASPGLETRNAYPLGKSTLFD
jgi:hypothetical protein